MPYKNGARTSTTSRISSAGSKPCETAGDGACYAKAKEVNRITAARRSARSASVSIDRRGGEVNSWPILVIRGLDPYPSFFERWIADPDDVVTRLADT